jgi:hypothetical protein
MQQQQQQQPLRPSKTKVSPVMAQLHISMSIIRLFSATRGAHTTQHVVVYGKKAFGFRAPRIFCVFLGVCVGATLKVGGRKNETEKGSGAHPCRRCLFILNLHHTASRDFSLCLFIQFSLMFREQLRYNLYNFLPNVAQLLCGTVNSAPLSAVKNAF